jgi:CheY-like chemotaxis protein
MNPIFLIVEDEPITSRFIREIIEDMGYEVAGSAKSALEARKFLAGQHYRYHHYGYQYTRFGRRDSTFSEFGG